MGLMCMSPYRLFSIYAVITYLIGAVVSLLFFQSVNGTWYTVLVGLLLGFAILMIGVIRWTFSLLDGIYQDRIPLMNSPTKIGGTLFLVMLLNSIGLGAYTWQMNKQKNIQPNPTITVEHLHVHDDTSQESPVKLP